MPTDPPSDLHDEFKTLGANLAAALRAAWHESSPDRQKVQGEIETGLAQAARVLAAASAGFMQSEAGQKLRAELMDLKERAQAGQVEATVRADVLAALQRLNAELARAAARAGGGAPGAGDEG